MSYIETHRLEHSTIQSIHSEWESIVRDPDYQRSSDIWSQEKKQLLVDSIINRYDIPKLYFHKFDRATAKRTGKAYAIIDGRQRLETIYQFIEGGFPLGPDFVYLEDPAVKARGMTYNELAQKYPRIKSRFDSFSLPIVTVETDDLELIEDMFSRLNEAVPLNAAEKRNAFGGDLVKAVNEVARHHFFTRKVKFGNKRYNHRETATRLLFLVHNLKLDRVVDTKKVFLDGFARDFARGKTAEVAALKTLTVDTLDEFAPVFADKDVLLATQVTIPIYFIVFRGLVSQGKKDRFTRSRLAEFSRVRAENRAVAEQDMTKARFELLEFDRLTQQGSNDASSIRERWRILDMWLLGNLWPEKA
jgi:hypothetical protein